MKVVWVNAMRNEIVELDPESVRTYGEKSGILLFWENHHDQPLLVLGLAGNHVITYSVLAEQSLYSDLDTQALTAAGTLCNGMPVGWESSNYKVSTPKHWQEVISKALQSSQRAVSA